MEPIYIYNTLTRKKERFNPLVPNTVSMYCCGPTVYNYAHLGNLRTYIFEDVIRRAFEFNGLRVTHVMNITDIGHLSGDGDDGEDKMIQSARAKKMSVLAVAQHYTDAFFADTKALNIKLPHTICRATEHIDDMIRLIQRLQQNGLAYSSAGNIYFDTQKFKTYGQLRGNSTADEQRYARVTADTNKKHVNDFVLWFTKSKYDSHAMLWDSPWGRGYPGWHIECSAMSIKYLGERFDVHCGGVDHIPTHHTNEIAQVEGATRKQWVNYWIHGEFLLMHSEKMSKSTQSFHTLSDCVQQKFSPLDFRYFCLNGHHQSQLNFSQAVLQSAHNALHNIRARIQQIQSGAARQPSITRDEQLSVTTQQQLTAGKAAINDNFNTPQLLAALWDTVKHDGIREAEKIWLIALFDAVLGLDLLKSAPRDASIDSQTRTAVETLISKRNEARQQKDWVAADAIRVELTEMGIAIEDSARGTTWRRV